VTTLFHKLQRKYPHIPPDVLKELIHVARVKGNAAEFDIYAAVNPTALKINTIYEIAAVISKRVEAEGPVFDARVTRILQDELNTLIHNLIHQVR
jgi:hypothetical protein